MKQVMILAILVTLSAAWAADPLFQLKINPELLKEYDRYQQKAAEITSLDGNPQILFSKEGALWIPLDINQFAGKKVQITLVYKCEGVPDTPPGVNPSVFGFKVMLCGSSPDKQFVGWQLGPFRGSCDWKGSVRKLSEPIPAGLNSFRLELSSPGGNIWIDELFIEEIP